MSEQSIPPKAEALHQAARAKGQSGDYEAALELLAQASELAPAWAYPHYDRAFTYLLMGDRAQALAGYREVDRLQPDGFFTIKTTLWTLEREADGRFPAGTYMAYLSLEWQDPADKPGLIDALLDKLPALAPAWKEKALITDDPVERMGYLERTLSLEPDAETRGVALLNKALVLSNTGHKDDARALFTELADGPDSTHASRAIARQLLETV